MPVRRDRSARDDPAIRLHARQELIQDLSADWASEYRSPCRRARLTIIKVDIDEPDLLQLLLPPLVFVVDDGVAAHLLELGALVRRPGDGDDLAFGVGERDLRCNLTVSAGRRDCKGRTRPTDPAAPEITTVSPSFSRPMSKMPWGQIWSKALSNKRTK